MLHTYSKYLATAITVFVSVCFVTNSHADTADNIMRASDTEILKIGKMMAEGVSKNSPAQIDSTTVLLGAIFVQETKTFIYKYKSTIRLDPNLMKQMIPPDTCSSPIRKNLMKRGMTFKHVYITPIGEQSQAVRVSDCP